ncbi:hypothetical protein NEIG_01646 [Nematocida sp. ERTm5]|nr:hypothetical protein NEIRO02_0914 [Nematocida sp. AWRm79]KAI5183084.1 hypothetical protein NEIRO03_0708 [Nematocida sp. AWRm78]OAG32536.1 hypothetical protein NEIG_01646 [Nematocida sp. ERTm5]
MQISYKAAEGFFFLAPALLSYTFSGKLNEIVTKYVMYVRLAFVASIILDMAVSYRIKRRIEMHNVKTKIKFATDDYIVIPAAAQDENEEQAQNEQKGEVEIEMTVHDYDLKVINAHISRILSNAAIHLAIHLFMKSGQPLMMLIFNPLKHFILFPPYIEYITGRSMLRPFSRNYIIGGSEKRKSAKPAEKVDEIPEKEMKVKKEE